MFRRFKFRCCHFFAEQYLNLWRLFAHFPVQWTVSECKNPHHLFKKLQVKIVSKQIEITWLSRSEGPQDKKKNLMSGNCPQNVWCGSVDSGSRALFVCVSLCTVGILWQLCCIFQQLNLKRSKDSWTNEAPKCISPAAVTTKCQTSLSHLDCVLPRASHPAD